MAATAAADITGSLTAPPSDAGDNVLQRATSLKELGGECFKAGKLEDALHRYGEALETLAEYDGIPADLRTALCSNQALCLLKLERFAEAEERAGAALAVDPGHSKASYRRGLARLQLGDARGAVEDFQRASRLEPQNKEIRQRLEEAQTIAEATPVREAEVTLASAAVSALGATKDGGLYGEKPDLNEGRLAETYREQREWIKTISAWNDITDISFADEEGKVSVYMTLPGLHEVPTNKVCVWLHATSMEVRVIDLRGANYCYVAQELWGQIDPAGSSWKVRKDKLSIKLAKRASARNWDKWDKLRRI